VVFRRRDRRPRPSFTSISLCERRRRREAPPPGRFSRDVSSLARQARDPSDLSEIWQAGGPGALQKVGMRDPTQLARLAYATLPKDILVSVEQRIPGGLSAEDWGLLQEVLNMIRGAIPPGSNSPPAEVFGVIETALRAHFARQIEP